MDELEYLKSKLLYISEHYKYVIDGMVFPTIDSLFPTNLRKSFRNKDIIKIKNCKTGGIREYLNGWEFTEEDSRLIRNMNYETKKSILSQMYKLNEDTGQLYNISYFLIMSKNGRKN